jgi:soluble lytic murein transglycosylase-like protein
LKKLLVFALLPIAVFANDTSKPPVKFLTLNEATRYSISAGKAYGVSPLVVFVIGAIESNHNVYAFNPSNKNGTADMGVMQINSTWIPKLKQYGLYDVQKIYDPEYNIHVGAWILKQCVNTFGQSWKSIDCYNKGPGKAQNEGRYVQKFINTYKMVPSQLSIYLSSGGEAESMAAL